VIVLHVWWQLHQEHSTGSAQRMEAAADAPKPGLWCIEPRSMGEAARSLDSDAKVLWNLSPPAHEGTIGGPVVIRTVDLDGREVLHIVGQPVTLRRPLRVEHAVPVIVAPAGCADMNHHTFPAANRHVHATGVPAQPLAYRRTL